MSGGWSCSEAKQPKTSQDWMFSLPQEEKRRVADNKNALDRSKKIFFPFETETRISSNLSSVPEGLPTHCSEGTQNAAK